jgi:hypothetical protein
MTDWNLCAWLVRCMPFFKGMFLNVKACLMFLILEKNLWDAIICVLLQNKLACLNVTNFKTLGRILFNTC